MKFWQQSGGDGDRNYVDICLRWGVILIGPSVLGAWNEQARERYSAQRVSARKCTDLDRFSFQMSDGDLVLLRLGTKEIHGIGKIVGDYEYHKAFLDIDGWDIAHVRRVLWLWKSEGNPKQFGTFSLKQGDTTQLLSEGERTKEIRNWVNDILVKSPPDSSPLPALPALPPSDAEEISLLQACQPLYDCGLSASSVSSVHDKMADLSKLAGWYRTFGAGKGVSENETVAQLVLPLLGALGWSPQTLAMEWSPAVGGRIDLAAFRPFRGSVRNDDDITLIVEAKRLDSSCLKGVEQARAYARSLHNCQRLVVSDGMRYAIFLRATGADNFGLQPAAYLNLLQPKDSYPILECEGADEALLLLSAAWHPQLSKHKPVGPEDCR